MIKSNVFDTYEIILDNGERTALIAKDEDHARRIIKILLPSASIKTIFRINDDSATAA